MSDPRLMHALDDASSYVARQREQYERNRHAVTELETENRAMTAKAKFEGRPDVGVNEREYKINAAKRIAAASNKDLALAERGLARLRARTNFHDMRNKASRKRSSAK